MYKEIWRKLKDLIRSKINKADDYDKKFMKIILNSDDDDDSPFDEALELHNMTTVVKFVFYEDNKYYLEAFLDECL